MTRTAIRRVGVVLKTTSHEAADLGRQLLTEVDRLGLDWPPTHAYLKIFAAQMFQAAIVVEPSQIAGVV